MPSLRNRDVVEAFLRRERADSGHLHSDGGTLRSYAMPIARWVDGGKVQIVDRSDSPSRTTSRHINMVRKAVPPLRIHPEPL